MKRVQEPWKNNAAPTRIYCFYPNVLICFVIYPICCQLKSLFSTTRQKTGHFYLFSAIYSSSSVFLCSRRRVSERERDIYLPMPLSRAVHFGPIVCYTRLLFLSRSLDISLLLSIPIFCHSRDLSRLSRKKAAHTHTQCKKLTPFSLLFLSTKKRLSVLHMRVSSLGYQARKNSKSDCIKKTSRVC